MAYEIIDWKNKGETGAKPINRDNLRHMDNGILNLDTYKAEITPLLTVSDTAPVECERGDLYYNTTTELIYVATQPDTWSEEGTTPSTFNLYVDLSSSKLYYYDGTNFNSYGSGGGGVVDGYSTSTTDSYSCNYANKLSTYSTDEIRIGTWIDGKPIYRKVYIENNPTTGEWAYINTDNTYNIKMYKGFYQRTNNRLDALSVGREDAMPLICTIRNNQIEYKIDSIYASGKISVYFILEYTKTTD